MSEKEKKFINKKNVFTNKAFLSYTQILILLISSFAFCWLIYQATLSLNTAPLYQEDILEKKLIKDNPILKVLLNKIKKPILPLISATEGTVCCEETKEGKYCVEVSPDQCKEDSKNSPSICLETKYCWGGCCQSTNTGICSPRTPQILCNGTWYEDMNCNVQSCQYGCCIIGNNAVFTNERNCNFESSLFGVAPNFKPEIRNEFECIFLTEKESEGACVLSDNSCKFTTAGECKTKKGSFYKNIFCSNSNLTTSCIPHSYDGCLEGKEGVYWFDSCGNREEIKEICSIFSGSVCGLYDGQGNAPTEGDYYCKSIDCIDGEGNPRKNGESWCEYDGVVGEGKDIVGSRHIKHICIFGEDVIEPCADYRNGICVGTTNIVNGESFSEATCRFNNWRDCYYNQREEGENPDCFVKTMNVANKFTPSLNVPHFPPGFNLETNYEDAQEICGRATQTCTVIYEKKLKGWVCVMNCACEKAGAADKMNELCTSLGDCGMYVNIAGDVSKDGFRASGTPAAKNDGKEYVGKTFDKIADSKNLSFLGGFLSGEQALDENGEPMYDNEGKPIISMPVGLGIAAAGIGLTALAGTTQVLTPLGMQTVGLGFLEGAGSMSWIADSSLTTTATANPGMMAFGNALAAFGIMVGIGSLAVSALGIKGQGAQIINTAAMALGAYAAVGILTGGALPGTAGVAAAASAATSGGLSGAISGLGSMMAAMMVLIIIFIFILIIVLILGLGKTKKKYVVFTCEPWQAPAGGANCNYCGSDGVPCSDYRCKSLGQTCELINKGTDDEKCVNNPLTDISSPKISPFYEILHEDFEYKNVNTNGFELKTKEDNCIPEYSPLIFGIQTDKPSQCKIDTDPLKTYSEMENYFGTNSYVENHTMPLSLPSIESFAMEYNLTTEQLKLVKDFLGEIKFYVKCKSINGVENAASYTIKTCVEPGPDITAPRITATVPIYNSIMAYNQTEEHLIININEPANCKWSREDEEYEDMENLFECLQDLGDYDLFGWPCNTRLNNITENSTYYIRCQDISENKNTMKESFPYKLRKSISELKIVDFKPEKNKELFFGFEPCTLNLQIKTEGGADGTAICSYSLNSGTFVEFKETNAIYHKQTFSTMIRGNYDVQLKCVDIAGNTANEKTSFKVTIDTIGPRITRIYNNGGLVIWTNEEAECRYSFGKFVWENATIMNSAEFEHSAEWKIQTYTIQCVDKYGNKGNKITVKPYTLLG
jgi:hypothetical protein